MTTTTTIPLDGVTRTVRPWGRFDQLVTNHPCTVKIITVQPGQRLSLQRHHNRDEMWHVLDGPVDVVVDAQPSSLSGGERIWVPRGTTHRLGNSGSAAVRILEVAFGLFDEDDIERLDDDYDRLPR